MKQYIIGKKLKLNKRMKEKWVPELGYHIREGETVSGFLKRIEENILRAMKYMGETSTTRGAK
ncbi:hypothetical protein LCGC14_0615120 [marine sediment metagenome]|uniref:Uncharacterized protein n=1 Tax=marine sediment metagenome TaxID=412755 RepID=A0A0F9RQM1_9ZZZZ|nr:hypothetical protein [bacterium]